MSVVTTILTASIYLLLRVVPLLVAAVFLAELARLWLGNDRLRRLLISRSPWQGRLRAALLGALLPFCECGAFPMMVGLLQAGVPLGVTLTFFMVSPVVSVPAFMFLVSFFGLQTAVLYLLITVSLGILASILIGGYAERAGAFKGEVFAGVPACEGGVCRPAPISGGCGTEVDCSCNGERTVKDIVIQAGRGAWKTLRRVLPYAGVAMLLASILQTQVPTHFIERIFNFAAPFDVPVAAAAGIPIYSGDCSMISLVVPFISITGAVGPGMAFLIAGAGTSINGLIFMNSIFNRRFLGLFILSVFIIALLTGYILGALS